MDGHPDVPPEGSSGDAGTRRQADGVGVGEAPGSGDGPPGAGDWATADAAASSPAASTTRDAEGIILDIMDPSGDYRQARQVSALLPIAVIVVVVLLSVFNEDYEVRPRCWYLCCCSVDLPRGAAMNYVHSELPSSTRSWDWRAGKDSHLSIPSACYG